VPGVVTATREVPGDAKEEARPQSVDAEGGERPGKAKTDDGEWSFQSQAGELCVVANIVHIDCQRAVEETMYTMIHALPTGCCRDDAAASGY
jgi:hypothetical protein